MDDAEIQRLLRESAFEVLARALPGTHVPMLRRQRRMPETVADFISRYFYGGRIETEHASDWHDRLITDALTFVDTSDLPPGQRGERSGRRREKWGQRGATNPTEARLLVALAVHYQGRGADWAIIVPYRAQVAAIRAALVRQVGDSDLVRLNVDTVDGFQGGERDVLLYGFTRSNPQGRVGFLGELRRANVALTRARQRLVMVGDLSTLLNADHGGFRGLAEALHRHVRDRGQIRAYAELWDRLAGIDGGGAR